jgi:hypothetical protein
MRKIALLAVAGFVLAIAAVAYAQSQVNTYEVTGATKPAKAGSKKKPVPVGISFGYEVGEQSGNRPSPVKKYSIRFAGLRVNPTKFPACTPATLESKGPKGCPSGSAVGTGFIENATGAKTNPADRSIACNAALTVYNGGKNKAVIYVAGDPNASDPREKCAIELAAPIPARFVKRGSMTALEFTVPPSLLHPLPTLDNAVVKVTSTIKNVKRKSRGYYEAIGGCKGGKRAGHVVFTPESGPAKTVKSTARCS